MNEGVYFWHADKHESALQVNTIILGVPSQTCPKYKITNLNISAISPENNGG